MADQYPTLTEEHINWIAEQHIFFTATAAHEGRVNLSPKGQDSLKIVSPTELVWLNLTGSGNETAAHLLESNRMTVMWCAFDGLPRILRIYGTAVAIHPRDPAWAQCTALIPAPLGARQYFKVAIEMVQTSCGYSVPLMDFSAERNTLKKWADKRGVDGIKAFWESTNTIGLDGQPTGIDY